MSKWKLFVGKHKGTLAVVGKDGLPIVDWQGFDDSRRPYAQHKKNATLIAAAPDMLECLEDVEDYFSADYFDEDSETAKMVKRIRKVIKKATK